MKYTIDSCNFDEGGSAEFFSIKENKKLGFKQFRSKKSANSAYQKQKLLSKYGLAPKVVGKVCKLKAKEGPITYETNWGFVTERAKIVDEKTWTRKLDKIQNLVDTIQQKTGLKFWDCHYYNIGYIKRKNKAKLVCIDTGSESFDRNANAWGYEKPGPKCDYCDKCSCNCEDSSI